MTTMNAQSRKSFEQPARPALETTKINGCSEFATARDTRDDATRSAYAIVSIMESGFGGGDFGSLNPELTAGALRGVGMLLALSSYAQDLIDHDKRYPRH